jgi:hypothetical protein
MAISFRRLRWRYFGGWRMLLTSFVVAGAGLAFVAATLWGILEELTYRSQGVPVAARVVTKGTRKVLSPRKGPTTEYWLRYEYRDGNGRVHQGHEDTERDLWDQCREGKPVAVEYLRTSPGESHLARDAHGLSWLIRAGVIALGLLLFVGVCVGTVQLWGAATKRVQLVQAGTPAVGRVTEIAASDPRANAAQGSTPQHLLYLFADAQGQERGGESAPLPRTLISRWSPGDHLLVLYDPADPGRNEPDLFGVRAEDLARLLGEEPKG